MRNIILATALFLGLASGASAGDDRYEYGPGGKDMYHGTASGTQSRIDELNREALESQQRAQEYWNRHGNSYGGPPVLQGPAQGFGGTSSPSDQRDYLNNYEAQKYNQRRGQY